MNEKNNYGGYRKVVISVIAVAAVALCTIVGIIVVHLVQSKKSEDNYDKLAEKVTSIVVADAETDTAADAVEKTANDNDESEYEEINTFEDSDMATAQNRVVDNATLVADNPDYVGWIYGCGGAIDYPIVQSDNPGYYLKHDYNKDYSNKGAIFTNKLNGELINTDEVLYGHHMKNGSMFAHLCDYKDEQYMRQHPCFYVYSDSGDAQYEVFSVYWMGMKEIEELQVQSSGLGKGEYVQLLKERSAYDTGVEVSEDDVIMTLVTCEYSNSNGRMVVHCRKTM